MSTSVLAPTPAGLRPGAFGHATHLSCRECGATQDLGPFYACGESVGPASICSRVTRGNS